MNFLAFGSAMNLNFIIFIFVQTDGLCFVKNKYYYYYFKYNNNTEYSCFFCSKSWC